MNIELGQIVFVKSFGVRGERVRFSYKTKPKLEHICVIIGAYKEGAELPSHNTLICLMGEIGYFTGDLIKEVFGEAGFKKLGKAHLAKYDGQERTDD